MTDDSEKKRWRPPNFKRAAVRVLRTSRSVYNGAFELPKNIKFYIMGKVDAFHDIPISKRIYWLYQPIQRSIFMAPDPSYSEERLVGDRHKSLSKNLSLTTIAMVVFVLFCIVTLTAPDEVVIARNAKVKLPFANVDIPFGVFLVVGPIMLLSILTFLQILIGQWYRIGGRFRANALPYVFNINRILPQAITLLVWYGLVPVTMLVFSFRAMARPWFFFYVILAFSVVVSFVMWRRLNRRETRTIKGEGKDAVAGEGREEFLKVVRIYYSSTFFLFLLLLFAGSILYMRVADENPFRGLYLVRASLERQDLTHANLRGANMKLSCLREADLSNSDLSGAFLRGADLSGSEIGGTKIGGADLKGASLLDTVGGSCEILKTAQNWELTVRSDDLLCGARSLEKVKFRSPCKH